MTSTLTSRRKPALACSIVSNLEQLDELRSAWSDLLARSSSNEPMLSPTWLLAWWRTYGSTGSRKLRVVAFWDGSRLVGLAPFLVRRHWYLPGIPFLRLEALGTGERESEHVYSEYLNLICEQGSENEVVEAFVAAIVSGTLGRWDELVIPRMDGDGVLPCLLSEAFGRAHIPTSLTTTESSPFVPLPATWEAYLEALSSSRRYFLRRTLRDFDRWAGGEAKYHHAATVSDLEAGKQILIALHNGRWTGGCHPGMFRSPRYQAFHDTVMPALFEEGALELLWLSIREEPIAALYNIVWNGKVYFYQSGRKTDLPAQIRPGVVMQAYALRRAIEAGRREYDFLGGAVQYKVQLALGSRPLVHFRAVRCAFRERARCCAAYGIGNLKQLRKVMRTKPWISGHKPENRKKTNE